MASRMSAPASAAENVPASYPCGACGNFDTARYSVARDVEYFTSGAAFTYVQCRGCGAVSLANPPVDQLSRIYPPNYYSFQPVQKSLALRVKDALDKRVFRGCLGRLPIRPLAVMDVGGGIGYQLDLIRNLDRRVVTTTVVDLDSQAETIAQGHGHSYFHGRIEDYESTIRYDLVLALNLIEHVVNPLEVLTKLKNCLTPEGMILIKTPNIDSLDARLFRHTNWGGYHCPRHWVLFDKRSFLSLASKAGLAPVQFKYTQGAPFWAISFLAKLHKRGCVRLDAEHPTFTHPLYKLFIILFAAFDLLRGPVAKPSQMFCVLRRA
jgi:2-polyprenyl-3-methyl-5-hydroxy-6-metoxy-1,4-benzoquinol methylase